MGNKLDLEDEARAVTKLQAEEWCDKNGNIEFMETSARDNQNIEEAFMKLASKALKRQVEMQKYMDASQELSRQLEREKNKRLEKPIP